MNPPDRLVLITSRHQPHTITTLADHWAPTGKVIVYVDREDVMMPAYVEACEQAGIELLAGDRFGVRGVAERYSDSYGTVIVVVDHAADEAA